MTLSEFEARLADINGETSRCLGAVPYDGRYGDWDGLIAKHRQMLPILERHQERQRDLHPPPECAGAYWIYLSAYDRQLGGERAVLAAAESRDYEAYMAAVRALTLLVHDVRIAGEHAGLRATRPAPRNIFRIWATMPWYVMRALLHSRAERRAGRSWT